MMQKKPEVERVNRFEVQRRREREMKRAREGCVDGIRRSQVGQVDRL